MERVKAIVGSVHPAGFKNELRGLFNVYVLNGDGGSRLPLNVRRCV